MIKSLKLTNWRNYSSYKTDFDRYNVILGPNASGKTNILESIYFCSNLTSWRSVNDQDLVKWNRDYFEINLNIVNQNNDLLRVFVEPREIGAVKRIEINKTRKTRKTLNEMIKTVLFSPEQIDSLFTPGGRRQYLNHFLSQKDYHYGYALRQYSKVVRAKNIILEKISENLCSRQELDFWNQKLVESAEILTNFRRDWFKFINAKIKPSYRLISGTNEKIYLEFYLKTPPEKLMEKIIENTNKEISAGITLYGPHRDDWGINLKGYDLIKTGSRGEWRSALIGIKVLEAQYLSSEELKPVMLLDDFLSELDDSRKANFFNEIKEYQVILTSAESSNLKIIGDKWNVVTTNG